MKQKTSKLSGEQILDILSDIAEEKGFVVEDYILALQADSEALSRKKQEGLPEDIISELETARELKKENRNRKKNQLKDESAKKEIEFFKSVFPDVKPDDIPAEVWDEVADGISLAHAYALYLVTESNNSDYAEKVNGENLRRATSKTDCGETEPSFTKEQVEAMNPKDVSKNFKHILKSVSAWKL